MSNEPDIQTRIRLRLVDWTDDDAEQRAVVDACGMDLQKLRDLYKEYLDEDGGCDHSANVCACGDYAYLEEADVALGLARWCDCSQQVCTGDDRREGEDCCLGPCDKCGMTGIIYLPFVVGMTEGGKLPTGEDSRRFPTEDEAAKYIGMLPDAGDGRYYLDAPEVQSIITRIKGRPDLIGPVATRTVLNRRLDSAIAQVRHGQD